MLNNSQVLVMLIPCIPWSFFSRDYEVHFNGKKLELETPLHCGTMRKRAKYFRISCIFFVCRYCIGILGLFPVVALACYVCLVRVGFLSIGYFMHTYHLIPSAESSARACEITTETVEYIYLRHWWLSSYTSTSGSSTDERVFHTAWRSVT